MKTFKTDLHIHTTASDGAMTPTEITRWANKNGLDIIAITDHDNVGGIDEAIESAKKYSIKVVPGIEISTFSNCEIHVLGYNFDYKNHEFLQELERIKDMRKERNAIIIDKLQNFGMHLDINPRQDGIGRLNIAKEMLDKKYVHDINEAFELYLGPKGKVYTEIRRTTPIEAVKLIKKYGGISSLAHPKKYLLDKRLEMLVGGLKQFGLDGLEVEYPRHTQNDVKELSAIADKYKLIKTGGSDFHGYEDKDFQVELEDRTLRALKLK